jgi:hypothetical protein
MAPGSRGPRGYPWDDAADKALLVQIIQYKEVTVSGSEWDDIGDLLGTGCSGDSLRLAIYFLFLSFFLLPCFCSISRSFLDEASQFCCRRAGVAAVLRLLLHPRWSQITFFSFFSAAHLPSTSVHSSSSASSYS